METPAWLDKTKVKISLDARPFLASGEHPLKRVITETGNLKPGEIYEIITPFPPVPMIEKLKVLGFESFTDQDDSGLFHTFFSRP